MFPDHYSLEKLALDRQRAILAEIAGEQRAMAGQTGGTRRALAAALSALARWLDPYAAGQVTRPVPAPHQ